VKRADPGPIARWILLSRLRSAGMTTKSPGPALPR